MTIVNILLLLVPLNCHNFTTTTSNGFMSLKSKEVNSQNKKVWTHFYVLYFEKKKYEVKSVLAAKICVLL